MTLPLKSCNSIPNFLSTKVNQEVGIKEKLDEEE